MSTLKICTRDHTFWITEISQVMEVGSFPWNPGDDPAAVWEKLEEKRGHRGALPSTYTVVGFQRPEESERPVGSGRVLRIDTRTGREMWFVPSGCSFLLGDNGKTIDRI